MVVLTLVIKQVINRWANIIIAALHALGVLASVFVGSPTSFYIFLVAVEVSTTLFIIWYAWSWKNVLDS